MNSEWKRGTTEIKQNEGGRIREAEARDYSSRMQLLEVRGGERLLGEDPRARILKNHRGKRRGALSRGFNWAFRLAGIVAIIEPVAGEIRVPSCRVRSTRPLLYSSISPMTIINPARGEKVHQNVP